MDDEEIVAWVASHMQGNADGVQRYATAGRRHASLSPDELQAEYEAALAYAAANINADDAQHRVSDISAEFALRGHKPATTPEVQADMRSMLGTFFDVLDEAASTPEGNRAGRAFLTDLAAKAKAEAQKKSS